METLTVHRASVAALAAAPNLAELVQAYAAESALPELGPAVLDLSAYVQLEAAGIAHFLGAWRGDRLVGFLVLIATPYPHWGGQVIASTESFFVHPDERHGGAGRKLCALAETVARDAGARGLIVAGPHDGALARVMPRWGYRQHHAAFFKPLPAAIAPATPDAIEKMRAFAEASLAFPQVDIETHHHFHAGMYARTARIPKDVVLTSALIKRATLLIIFGDVEVSSGDGVQRLVGFHIIYAPAQRKQVYRAYEETMVVMAYPSQAESVAEAEAEFTDECDQLLSRKQLDCQRVYALEG